MYINEEVKNKLLSFKQEVDDKCLITGGHFMLNMLKGKQSLNQGTLQSFEVAGSIFKEMKNNNKGVGLGILINDIGMTCEASVCYITDGFDKKNSPPHIRRHGLGKSRAGPRWSGSSSFRVWRSRWSASAERRPGRTA